MGRCPEDGQTVLFEATEDAAIRFFVSEDFAAPSRLTHVCAHVCAISTPSLSADYGDLAVRASSEFRHSYYFRVHDEPTWLICCKGVRQPFNSPADLHQRKLMLSARANLFPRSQQDHGPNLWATLDQFIWQDWSAGAYLLER